MADEYKKSNPFRENVCPTGGGVGLPATSPLVNQAAYKGLSMLLGGLAWPDTGGRGKVVLLRASSAGAGKTHLLRRMMADYADRAVFVPLRFSPGVVIGWETCGQQILSQFVVSGTGEVTPLERAAQALFAQVVQALIGHGEIPCDEKEQVTEALQADPGALFHPGDEGAGTAAWFRANFDRMLPQAARVVAGLAEIPTGASAFWLRTLFAFVRDVGNSPGERAEALWESVRRAQAPALPVCWVSELVRLVSLDRPVVVVADGLDALYGNAVAARAMTSALLGLEDAAPRVMVVLGVNDDVWEATFQAGLPGAHRDRLLQQVMGLCGISAAEAESLIGVRLASGGEDGELGRSIFQALAGKNTGWNGGQINPRALLRAAAEHWDDNGKGEVGGVEKFPPLQEKAPGAGAGKISDIRGKDLGDAPSVSRSFPPEPDSGARLEGGLQRARDVFERLQTRACDDAAAAGVPFGKISDVLSVAGNLFPATCYQDFSGKAGVSCGCWVFGRNRIFFLLAAVAEGVPGQIEAAADDWRADGPVKLVAFCRDEKGKEILEGSGCPWDLISLDPPSLAAIDAAHQVVGLAEEGAIELDRQELCRLLADGLNPFWKRVTRPLPATDGVGAILPKDLE